MGVYTSQSFFFSIYNSVLIKVKINTDFFFSFLFLFSNTQSQLCEPKTVSKKTQPHHPPCPCSPLEAMLTRKNGEKETKAENSLLCVVHSSMCEAR